MTSFEFIFEAKNIFFLIKLLGLALKPKNSNILFSFQKVFCKMLGPEEEEVGAEEREKEEERGRKEGIRSIFGAFNAFF